MIWQKIVILGLALLAALWLVIAHGVAYQRTKIRHRLLQSGSFLLIALIAVRFLLGLLFDPSYARVSIISFLILPLVSGSQIAVLWFASDKYPRYRHSRDLLLLRQPQPLINIAPDPSQGLYVPHANLPHPSLSARQRLIGVALGVGLFLLMVLVLWLL